MKGADVWVQADERAYLVNAGKILDDEAEKNPGEQSPSHLQGTSQQVVPGGALNEDNAPLNEPGLQRVPAPWKTHDGVPR